MEAMSYLPFAKDIIAEFEGCKLRAYPDPGTKGDPWTIGYGHTGADVRPGMEITQAQAEKFLESDILVAAKGVFELLPMAQHWTPKQQAALISFAFNVGLNSLKTSTLRQRLLAKQDPLTVIKEELPRWNKGGSGVMPGLVRRRAAEVLLFGEGVKAPTAGPAWPAGMVGPRIRPPLKPGDSHLIANDINETMTAYDSSGQKLWTIPCLCRGQGRDTDWERTGEDTPPGLYLLGRIYADWEEDPNPTFSEERRSFGWYSIDAEGQEGQEGPASTPYRDGIMVHGGGKACGWPGAWAPRQPLFSTLGCVRAHNIDIRDKILPLMKKGKVWMSVLQEARK